jgi:hypothetical protein
MSRLKKERTLAAIADDLIAAQNTVEGLQKEYAAARLALETRIYTAKAELDAAPNIVMAKPFEPPTQRDLEERDPAPDTKPPVLVAVGGCAPPMVVYGEQSDRTDKNAAMVAGLHDLPDLTIPVGMRRI